MTQPKVDALLNTVACTLIVNLAGPQAGLSTLLGKFIERPYPAMMALSACPPCCKPQGYQLDIYHQSKLYDSDKIGYMLEALRINGPPVAGSHKVVDDRGFKCPFLNGRKVSLPSGSVVMADYFSSAMDPKFWHEPYTFDITRKKEDYIFFNGPYGRWDSAPRKCPGESVSMCLMSMVLDKVLEQSKVNLNAMELIEQSKHHGDNNGGASSSAPHPASMGRPTEAFDVESVRAR